MASYQKRRNSDGTTSVLAWVRVKGFQPASRSFPDKAQAREWASSLEASLRQERERGQVRADLPALTVKGLIDEYLADPETQQLKYYATGQLQTLLGWWVSHYGAEKVLGFGVLKLREGRDRLRPGRGPATVNRHLSVLRSCWNWGRAAGLVPMERSWPTRLMLKEPRERARFLSDPELAAVLAAAREEAPWLYAAIVASLATGVRQAELLRLTWADLDFERGTLTVLISKNTKRRAIHLNQPAMAALKALKRGGIVSTRHVFLADTGEPLNKHQLNYRWEMVREAAGLRDFRWHDLRHSCASYLAQNGATLLEIGDVLGHSSPAVTMKYAHLVQGKAVTGSAALAAKLTDKQL